MSRLAFIQNLFVLLVLLGLNAQGVGQDKRTEGHVQAAMRMIGHQTLLDAGDSTSRVLPIQKEDDRYKISFATKFSLDPEKLVATVDSIVGVTDIGDGYIVEIETCDSALVVYSYEIGGKDEEDIIACRSRELPKDCYKILISLSDSKSDHEDLAITSALPNDDNSSWMGLKGSYMIGLFIIPFSALLALFLYFKKKKQKEIADADGILIGEYRFDKRNMVLSIQDQKLELTSKEADLLYLLHASANDTVEREVMLKEVWGDQGDYVGRTLDVFISKLRKKLEADPSIRIANIRGVGYKLILND